MGYGKDEDWDDFGGVVVEYDTWTTKTGEEVYIAEMNDRHLRNTVRMLIRKGAQNHPRFFSLVEEIRKRGLRI